MSDSQADPTSTSTFCAIAGCTDHVTTSRWIVVEDVEGRHIEVCWKHAEGDLDPASVEPV